MHAHGAQCEPAKCALPWPGPPPPRAQLAEYMFNTEAAMVRLDMSEYMEKVGGRVYRGGVGWARP